jgi:drug/metabolite transporter (DMT)-like permease
LNTGSSIFALLVARGRGNALKICGAGILSTIFLKRKLKWFQWFGMIVVIGGLVTVGANDLINGDVSPHSCTPVVVQSNGR